MRRLLLSAILCLGWASAHAEVIRLDAATQARAGLIVRPVQERSFGDQIRVLGQTVRSPGATHTVKTILEGRVERLLVTPGEAVAEGQPLVELHSHMLHQLQGELLSNREALALAESRVQAGRQLLEIEGISRIEVEAREQAALAARLALRHSKAELHDLGYGEEEIRQLLETSDLHPVLTVQAPATGVVLEVPVQQHAWVQAFDPLLVIGNPRSLELELQIPPDEAIGVAPGNLVEFVPVGRSEAWCLARVVTQVPQVDSTTRTVTVRAEITHGLENLLPGVYVEGNLIRGDVARSPSVPESALIRIGASDYVFVRLDPESLEARPVTVGRFNGSRYEITSGVEVGEEVAVQGVFLLKSALIRAGEGD